MHAWEQWASFDFPCFGCQEPTGSRPEPQGRCEVLVIQLGGHMNADTILHLLQNGSPEERQSFVRSCPPSKFQSVVVPLAGSDHLGTVVVAMSQLAMEYCEGLNPKVGAEIARATHIYAHQVAQSEPNHGLLPSTLSRIACQHINALGLLGRSEEVVAFTDQYIQMYEEMDENENLPPLKAARINALLNLNRIDEAEQMFNDPKLRGNWGTDMEINRLERKLKNIKAKITDIASDEQREIENEMPSASELVGALKQMISHSFEDPSQREQLLNAADQMDPDNRIDMKTKGGFEHMMGLLSKGEALFTKGGDADCEWTYKRKIREASSIFAFESNPATDAIKKSLAELIPSRHWAKQNRLIDLENDALWGIYLCHSRMNEPSLAADALIDIRRNLEETRSGISDPMERGGVFSIFPHLFDVLCEKLYTSNRPEELLEAIEASKGRGMADILTWKSGHAVADAGINKAVASLPELTRKEGFHYLSYYVDNERTYAVLVSKQGNIHAPEPIAISKQTIRQSARYVDPRSWGQFIDWDYSSVIQDVSEILSPLVNFLNALIKEGVVSTGDHITYSADDSFHNVPLHYLIFNGKPLIETFSLSRIHNAFHLKNIMDADVLVRPKNYTAFVVPTIQNTRQENWVEMAGGMYGPVHWLQEHMAGELYEDENVTADRITGLDLSGKVVQFSAHGIFPQSNQSGNPFSDSGLVISDGQNLPDGDRVALGDLDCVLTPRDILNRNHDFSGSHVSLMACVSGLSREGLGGDALGMDWAFMQAGAASLISSHWMVKAPLAGAFFERFYTYWLEGNQTRGAAYRQAIVDLRSMGGAYASPSSWAAFSLTGDWR